MHRLRSRSDSLRWMWLLFAIGIAPPLSAQATEAVAGSTEESDDPILEQALTPWTGDLDGILEGVSCVSPSPTA